MNSFKAIALVVAAILVSVPAFAQFELSGTWGSRSNQDEMERGPGPDPVDYLGLPLNDDGRAKALSYNYSMLSLPEYQCGYLTPFYIVLGPFGLRVWSELDPVTARIVAWKIGGWVDRDVTTLDGRTSASFAERPPRLWRLYDRRLGRRHADDVYHAHEGEHDPAQWCAGE